MSTSLRLLITPATIEALDPCAGRWRAYRASFPGRKPHALAALLTRTGQTSEQLHDDFLWVLHRLAVSQSPWSSDDTPPCALAAALWKRLKAAWLESPTLPEYSWLARDYMNPASCIYGTDTPRDWKKIALRVIATMEQEQNEARGSRA